MILLERMGGGATPQCYLEHLSDQMMIPPNNSSNRVLQINKQCDNHGRPQLVNYPSSRVTDSQNIEPATPDVDADVNTRYMKGKTAQETHSAEHNAKLSWIVRRV